MSAVNARHILDPSRPGRALCGQREFGHQFYMDPCRHCEIARRRWISEYGRAFQPGIMTVTRVALLHANLAR